MCHCAIKRQLEFCTEKIDVHGRRKDFIYTVMDSESAVNSKTNIGKVVEIALVFKRTVKSRMLRITRKGIDWESVSVCVTYPVIPNPKGYRIVGIQLED